MAGSDWKEFELSSGVTVLYGPFAHGLYWDIMEKALDEHPEPEVPQKTIQVLNGTEEVDDLENPEYVKAAAEARRAQFNLMADAVLELCVEVKGGMGPWEGTIERIAAKYSTAPPPDDPKERQSWFLKKYGLRTAEDWKLIGKVQRFSQIDDDEVRLRAEQFPGDVAGPEGDGAAAPGAAEE
jgi:hypothetical protein